MTSMVDARLSQGIPRLLLWRNTHLSIRSVTHSKVYGAIMGSTWVLSAPDGLHVGPMNLAIRGVPGSCITTAVWRCSKSPKTLKKVSRIRLFSYKSIFLYVKSSHEINRGELFRSSGRLFLVDRHQLWNKFSSRQLQEFSPFSVLNYPFVESSCHSWYLDTTKTCILIKKGTPLLFNWVKVNQ